MRHAGRRLPTRPQARAAAVSLSLLLLAACGSGGGDDGVRVQNQPVSASAGGTVADLGGAIRVVIPPGALSADTRVSVRRVASGTPALGATMTAASDAFAVSFSSPATLSQPMRVEIAARSVPSHPHVGEVAQLVDGSWQRVGANFFRVADRKVIALTRTATTVQAVNRSLQAATGEAVARGRDGVRYQTFGNEAFFGGAVGLHPQLDNLTPA